MTYPLSVGLPLVINLSLQGLLWAGVFFHIVWLNRIAMLGISGGTFFLSCISLVFYRILALEKPWSLTIVFGSLLQAAAMANSLLFLYSAYLGAFPEWLPMG